MSNEAAMSMTSNPLLFDTADSNISISGWQGNQYPAPPLPANNHIRLVELKAIQGPLSSERAIFLKFHTVPLAAPPDFTALSYTWGASSRPNSINGIHVTDNLLSALMNLAESESKLWWIDALCINQADVKEKNEQVKMMRQIYAKAAQVCVWLGDPDTASLELLQKIIRHLRDHMSLTATVEYSSEELERLGLPPFEDPAWVALMRFLARPYFRRVWVLQEIVMAREPPQVACGMLRFRWPLLALPAHWLRETLLQVVMQSQSGYSDVRTQGQRHAPSSDIINLSMSFEGSRSLPLEYLIGTSRYLESTDPRDKIIALLGLASSEDQSAAKIKVDYGQPVADFYREVTGTIITTNRSLKLWSLVTDTSSGKVKGLPSWVPDYSIEMDRPNYRYAHFLTPNRNLVDVEWRAGSDALSIWVDIQDEVEFVADDVPSAWTDSDELLLSWFRAAARFKAADEWRWILSLAEPDQASSADAEQFWRTVLLDFVGEQSPAPEEYREHFAAMAFPAFLETKIENTEWLIGLAAAVILALDEDIRAGNPLEFDDLITLLIQLYGKARDAGRELAPLEYRIPRKWITPNEDGKLSLGPEGDRNAFVVEAVGRGTNRFFITKAGRMGKGPLHLQAGDQVAVAKGSDQVFLLREIAGDFRLIGECYAHRMHSKELDEITSFKKVTLV